MAEPESPRHSRKTNSGERERLRTYCKNADPTNALFIEPAVWGAFIGKWKRFDYGYVIKEYGGFSINEIREIAEKQDYAQFASAIRKIAVDITDRINGRDLHLEPVRYEERVDGASGKRRIIGIEHPFHQVVEHVAVYCLKELYKSRIEPCQYASLKGKGPLKGARQIEKLVQEDNERQKYCAEHGYRFRSETEFYVQGDIRKCYPSLTKEVAMREYRHDISKNKDLIWLIDELLTMHVNGLIIGSLLSQFTCNYLLSKAVREVFSYAKERRGERIRLVEHQIWYMDDFLLTGPDRRNLKMAFNQLSKYLKKQYCLDLKIAHIRRWSDAPPDIMGYIVHRDGTITIRGRTFVRAKRAFTRADGKEVIALAQARRIVSMKGYFKNSDCQPARKRLNVDEISERAQKLISNFDTGRLMQCIPRLSSTVASQPQSQCLSGLTVAPSTD